MYRIVIKSPHHPMNLQFESMQQSEAEQLAAQWCLQEAQRHGDPALPFVARLQGLKDLGLHRELMDTFLEGDLEVQLLHAGAGQLVLLGALNSLKKWALTQFQAPASHQTTFPDHTEGHSRAG